MIGLRLERSWLEYTSFWRMQAPKYLEENLETSQHRS
jgi:hypothetical protein